MFIEAHGYKTGKIIYLNADHITSLEPYKKGAAVVFGNTVTYTQESHHELRYRIEEGYKYANITL